jgi:DNA-binding NarL/FixJ family response regulator
MATRLELEQEAGRRAAAKRSVVAMAAEPAPDVVVSDLPMPVDAVVEELAKTPVKKRTRARAKPEEALLPEVTADSFDDLDDLLSSE